MAMKNSEEDYIHPQNSEETNEKSEPVNVPTRRKKQVYKNDFRRARGKTVRGGKKF